MARGRKTKVVGGHKSHLMKKGHKKHHKGGRKKR
jgi:hypothetical protein